MESERGQNFFDVAIGNVRAHHAQELLAREADFRGRLAARIHVHDARENFSAAQLLDQFRGAARSQLRHFRIGAALEAVGRFRAQAERLRRAANGDGIEPRGFEQNIAAARSRFRFPRRPSRRRWPPRAPRPRSRTCLLRACVRRRRACAFFRPAARAARRCGVRRACRDRTRAAAGPARTSRSSSRPPRC